MSEVTIGEVTSKDGTRIAFERSGEGPPLILVGGALSTRTAARDIAALLSSELVAFAYDRRGRGDSGDTAPYAVEREVEDLQALIEEAGGSAFVFGHSSGAGLTLETAARTGASTRPPSTSRRTSSTTAAHRSRSTMPTASRSCSRMVAAATRLNTS